MEKLSLMDLILIIKTFLRSYIRKWLRCEVRCTIISVDLEAHYTYHW